MVGAKNKIKTIDIYNENFNHFFVERLNMLQPEDRRKIPNELMIKIFRRGNEASAERLNFNEKLWILTVALQHKVTITIDSPDGISIKEFKGAVQAQKGEIMNSQLLDAMRVNSAFILGDTELVKALMYMAHVSTSPIYKLIQKEYIANASHKKDDNYKIQKDRLQNVLKLLINYEANKKRISSDYRIDPCQWLALLYFSTGEKLGTDFYNEAMRYATNSSRPNLHKGMKRMHDDGYLDRRGGKNDYRYSLTAKGINIFNRILESIIMKF